MEAMTDKIFIDREPQTGDFVMRMPEAAIPALYDDEHGDRQYDVRLMLQQVCTTVGEETFVTEHKEPKDAYIDLKEWYSKHKDNMRPAEIKNV